MTFFRCLHVAFFIALVSACTYLGESTQPAIHKIPTYQHDVIALENLATREIAYCYATLQFSAEECADKLQEKGYVRLTDIPRFTASDSALDSNTYPTRRWRSNNQIPRW